MLLCIDSGNTTIVFALFKGKTIHARWRIRAQSGRSCDEYAAWLMPMMDNVGCRISDITDVVISNVVPEAGQSLEELCRQYFDCDPFIITDLNCPLPLAVDEPSEVGADRIANATALRSDYSLPAVAVDFGTATTFDIVDQKGAYCGGVILPGIDLSLKILHRRTARLPHVALVGTPPIIGRSTFDAIRSGIFWGTIGQVEGFISRIRAEMGANTRFIATGGFGQQCASILASTSWDRDLTLRGMRCVYQDRKKHG